MAETRPRRRLKVKARVLLAAAAGAATVSIESCCFPVGNLMASQACGVDGGPPNCILETCRVDAGPPGCVPEDAGERPDGGEPPDAGVGGDR
jgi:hypothetical protein